MPWLISIKTFLAVLTRFYLRHNEKNGQGVNFMGIIAQRSLSDGTLRYRAEVRINRKDFPVYKESKTFSTKRMAEKWLKKREVEIEANPNIDTTEKRPK